MTPSSRVRAPRTRNGSSRSAPLAVPAVALLALTVVLVVAAPLAESAPVVKLVAPYSGTPFQTVAHYHQGCGFNHIAHDLLFSATTGAAHLNQESRAQRCTGSSNVLTIFQTTSDTGINSSAFSPTTSVPLAHAKVRWALTYDWELHTTWGNSSQTTYAFFSVEVLASIYDATTGATYLPTNSYLNSVTQSDLNSSSFLHVSSVPVTLFFNLSLSSTDLCQYNTSLRIITTVDTIGPGSDAFSIVLFYYPRVADRAALDWVTY
ncbi:MAG: hypothetical protein L3K05_05995 [Thermoplasmata archaeon]|nr:hypothetical protein [Thermoplasmata archaeon]